MNSPDDRQDSSRSPWQSSLALAGLIIRLMYLFLAFEYAKCYGLPGFGHSPSRTLSEPTTVQSSPSALVVKTKQLTLVKAQSNIFHIHDHVSYPAAFRAESDDLMTIQYQDPLATSSELDEPVTDLSEDNFEE